MFSNKFEHTKCDLQPNNVKTNTHGDLLFNFFFILKVVRINHTLKILHIACNKDKCTKRFFKINCVAGIDLIF